MLTNLRQRLFHIISDDNEVIRKGKLLHFLVIFLVIIAVISVVVQLLMQYWSSRSINNPAVFFVVPVALALASLILWFTQQGRILLAAHVLTGGLNFSLFIALILLSPSSNVYFIPYMMLIGIVVIAALDRIPASMFYTAVTGTAVSILFIFSPQYNIIDIVVYLFTLTGVSITFWLTASDLKSLTGSSKQLSEEVQLKNELLQKRADHLQLSVEISQKTSQSLDLYMLLKNTVEEIKNQFGFYYVSIFLCDKQNSNLVLKEASGSAGQALLKDRYTLPVDEKSIVGWVATHQQTHISHNVQQDPFYHSEALLKETKSELCLPLIARGRLLGVLDIQTDNPNLFQDDSIIILEIMANQIAVNIDNAQLFTQTETQLNETQTLLELNSLLTTTLEVGEIYRRAAREFAIKLGGTRCAISSWDKEKNCITIQAEFIHNAISAVDDAYITNYESYDLALFPETAKVLSSHTPKLLNSNDLNQIANETNTPNTQDLVCIELPLVIGIESLGTVKVYRDELQSFSQQEINLLQAMANQTATALNNAILTSNTRGQLAQFSSLNRMSVILSQASNLKEIFNGARREILSLVEATGMSISLLTEDEDKLNWIYGYEFGQEVDLSKIPLLPVSEGFSGQVVRTRELLYVPTANEIESLTVGANLSCWLGLPLIVANDLIGVLAVENDTEFTKRDMDLLRTIAGPLAIAINNLIQFEEIQSALSIQMRQRIQLETAAEVAASATSVLGLQELMQKSVDLIKDRFELYYVGLFLVDEVSNQAVLTAATGVEGERQLAESHQLQIGGNSLIGGATGDGNPRIIQNVHLEKEWFANPHLPETSSELALPLRVRGEVIGALTVQSVIPGVFDPDLLNILQTMTDQLAVGIENARLLSKAELEAQDQQLIHQVSSQFYQSVDVNSIVKLGLEAISQRLGGSDVQLTLGTKQRDE